MQDVTQTNLMNPQTYHSTQELEDYQWLWFISIPLDFLPLATRIQSISKSQWTLGSQIILNRTGAHHIDHCHPHPRWHDLYPGSLQSASLCFQSCSLIPQAAARLMLLKCQVNHFLISIPQWLPIIPREILNPWCNLQGPLGSRPYHPHLLLFFRHLIWNSQLCLKQTRHALDSGRSFTFADPSAQNAYPYVSAQIVSSLHSSLYLTAIRKNPPTPPLTMHSQVATLITPLPDFLYDVSYLTSQHKGICFFVYCLSPLASI